MSSEWVSTVAAGGARYSGNGTVRCRTITAVVGQRRTGATAQRRNSELATGTQPSLVTGEKPVKGYCAARGDLLGCNGTVVSTAKDVQMPCVPYSCTGRGTCSALPTVQSPSWYTGCRIRGWLLCWRRWKLAK